MGVVSNNWFDRGWLSIKLFTCSNPHVDRCSNPLPWDPLSSPWSIGLRQAFASASGHHAGQKHPTRTFKLCACHVLGRPSPRFGAFGDRRTRCHCRHLRSARWLLALRGVSKENSMRSSRLWQSCTHGIPWQDTATKPCTGTCRVACAARHLEQSHAKRSARCYIYYNNLNKYKNISLLPTTTNNNWQSNNNVWSPVRQTTAAELYAHGIRRATWATKCLCTYIIITMTTIPVITTTINILFLLIIFISLLLSITMFTISMKVHGREGGNRQLHDGRPAAERGRARRGHRWTWTMLQRQEYHIVCLFVFLQTALDSVYARTHGHQWKKLLDRSTTWVRSRACLCSTRMAADLYHEGWPLMVQ